MSIQDKIYSDVKTAMKTQDQDKLRVLRSLKSKLMEKKIGERKGGEEIDLSDEQATEVLMKAAKQRKESIEQFKKGGREELAEIEEMELEIIESYLPEMMTEDEIREVVKEQIHTTGASGMQDMGKVMGPVMGQLKGNAEGSLVSKVVKDELGG